MFIARVQGKTSAPEERSVQEDITLLWSLSV